LAVITTLTVGKNVIKHCKL